MSKYNIHLIVEVTTVILTTVMPSYVIKDELEARGLSETVQVILTDAMAWR